KLGGVCLNWGCIPTKALLAGAEFYHRLKHDADAWGSAADHVRHDWSKVVGRSRGVAGDSHRGDHRRCNTHKLTHDRGPAVLPTPGRVEVYEKDDTQRKGKPQRTLQAKRVLIATGAIPRELPGTPFDGEKVISSKEAMTMAEQPKKLLVIGAGAIGMEFAYFYN